MDFLKSTVLQYLTAMLVLLIIGFGFGTYTKGLSIERRTTVTTDTLKIEITKDSVIYEVVNRIIYKDGKLDTLIKHDTIKPVIYASMDTLFKYSIRDTIQVCDSLSIKYYFPDSNAWDITLKQDTKLFSYNTTTTIQQTVVPPPYAAPYSRYFLDRFDYGPTFSIGFGKGGLTYLFGVGVFYGLR